MDPEKAPKGKRVSRDQDADLQHGGQEGLTAVSRRSDGHGGSEPGRGSPAGRCGRQVVVRLGALGGWRRRTATRPTDGRIARDRGQVKGER